MNFDDVPHPDDFFVSTDKTLLDVPFVHSELRKTYWGSWMSLPTVLKAIDNSLCFGLYKRADGITRQLGFARVITDYATFAWICDVVIAESHRKKGLGKFMMNVIMSNPEVKPRSCLLTTRDAHGLYAKFGFTPYSAMKRQGGQT